MNSTRDSDESRHSIIDQGRTFTQSDFHTYESLILNNQINVVEGLVVDIKVGGIGFRNHIVPLDPGLGSEWTEGLLWIQSETVCVFTNISRELTTLRVPLAEVTVGSWENYITDRGGFSNLAEE